MISKFICAAMISLLTVSTAGAQDGPIGIAFAEAPE